MLGSFSNSNDNWNHGYNLPSAKDEKKSHNLTFHLELGEIYRSKSSYAICAGGSEECIQKADFGMINFDSIDDERTHQTYQNKNRQMDSYI